MRIDLAKLTTEDLIRLRGILDAEMAARSRVVDPDHDAWLRRNYSVVDNHLACGCPIGGTADPPPRGVWLPDCLVEYVPPAEHRATPCTGS